MPEAESRQADWGGSRDAEAVRYQAVSPMAITGLVVGLAAFVALASPLLWIVPLVGILLSGSALRRISSSSSMLTGRGLALAGLLVSVLWSGIAPAHWCAYRWLVRREARQFASLWFDCLRRNDPVRACQLAQDPRYRRPLAEVTKGVTEEHSHDRAALIHYLSRPEVRALLALGDRALVRHYHTAGQDRQKGSDFVRDVYAVTYEQDGQKTTFFIRLLLQRYRLEETRQAGWHLVQSEGGIRPLALASRAGSRR